jgi:hypothetical protein
MFCESYRKVLIEAAGSGEALSRELVVHLAACELCSSAFATEQMLFASIDRSLRAAVSAKVPASLVPRVRARLPESEMLLKRFSWSAILVPMTTFVLVTSFIMIPRFTSQRKSDMPDATVASLEAGVATRLGNPATRKNASTRSSSARKPLQNRRFVTPMASSSNIKVEPSTQVAIAQLVRIAHEQPEIAESFSRKSEAAFVEIKPIEVAEIRWEPLASDAEAKN